MIIQRKINCLKYFDKLTVVIECSMFFVKKTKTVDETEAPLSNQNKPILRLLATDLPKTMLIHK